MKSRPAEIERESMRIIREELTAEDILLPDDQEAVVLRCIHASADFDYARSLRFTPDAVPLALEALRKGCDVVTDTNMALAGISRPALGKLGGRAVCYMAEAFIAEAAKKNGTTRATEAMRYAAEHHNGAVFAVGNAPTALLEIAGQIEAGFRPALVIAVPVGFVNVTESKERVFEVCERAKIPAIAAMGRKGGSSIAAAVCNALIYQAAGLLDPEKRG